MMKRRCINFDWVEVYCIERGEPKTPEYFEHHGWSGKVKVRDYGTPMYRQMFTLFTDAFPLLEIRRDPYSVKAFGGIFDPRACHIRLSNRSCYLSDPIGSLVGFLQQYGYEYKNTTRVDICLDFQHFDNGDNPAKFLRDYLADQYTKVHQPRFAAHGKDVHDGKLYNSIKWGSNTSKITTKLYNKSLELNEVQDKPYIRQQWDVLGFSPLADVWRCEFSLNSEYKSMARLEVDVETGEMRNADLNIDIMTLRDREFLRFTFFAIADYYMDFRYIEYSRNGMLISKYKSKRKILFRTTTEETAYHPVKLTPQRAANRTDYMLIKRLQDITEDYEHYSYTERICAAAVIEGIVRQIAADRMGMSPTLVLDNFRKNAVQ